MRGRFVARAAGLAVSGLCLSLSLGGCARKHPGPSECRAIALVSVGVAASTRASQLARSPELARRAEELTSQCLTVPWDYQLLRCLQGGEGQTCLRRFSLRRQAEQSRLAPNI